MSGSLAGAVMTTFLAPAWRCLEDVALSRKTPVDSTTMSTPSSPQGSGGGVFHRADPGLAAVHEDGLALDRDFGAQGAVHGIVLEQVGQRLGIGEVIDRHDLDVLGRQRGPEKDTTDPPEPVDSHSHCHVRSSLSISVSVNYTSNDQYFRCFTGVAL